MPAVTHVVEVFALPSSYALDWQYGFSCMMFRKPDFIVCSLLSVIV